MTYVPLGDHPVNQVTVAFAVYNRPQYLRQVIDAWSKVRGVDEVTFEFHCEPGCPEVVDMCHQVQFTESYVHVNPQRLGHAWNVHKSMHWAYRDGADYVIQAVDDFLPSTDLLELHHWHRLNYAEDPTVLALRSGTDYQHDEGLGAVWRTQLIGILPGFHKSKWKMIAPWWEMGTANWWAWVNDRWLQSGQRLDVLAPAVSRAKDIGVTGSDGYPDPVAVSQFTADVPPQRYFEVKGRRERAIGFARFIEEDVARGQV